MHAHLTILFHLAIMLFYLVFVLFQLITMIFHFHHGNSIEQLFSPYIFDWAIYTPYYYKYK